MKERNFKYNKIFKLVGCNTIKLFWKHKELMLLAGFAHLAEELDHVLILIYRMMKSPVHLLHENDSLFCFTLQPE
jgi:hypothetical protein